MMIIYALWGFVPLYIALSMFLSGDIEEFFDYALFTFFILAGIVACIPLVGYMFCDCVKFF